MFAMPAPLGKHGPKYNKYWSLIPRSIGRTVPVAKILLSYRSAQGAIQPDLKCRPPCLAANNLMLPTLHVAQSGAGSKTIIFLHGFGVAIRSGAT